MRAATALALGLVAILVSLCPARAQGLPNGLHELAPQASAAVVATALEQICPATAIAHDARGDTTGCNACPPGTTSRLSGGSGRWTISGETIGHFTAPGAENLLLEGGGCEPHSNDYGGTFLFVLAGRTPKLLRYDGGLMTTPCRELSLRDGRDFLVCEGWREGQGYQTRDVYSLAFNPDGKARKTVLFLTHDDVDACGFGSPGAAGYVVQASNIKSVEFPDLNGDGKPDLTVVATLGRRKLTATEWKACGEPGSAFTDDSVPQQVYAIQYLFDGSGFRPTAAARPILKLFEGIPAGR